jgi:hypothetical protein
MTSEIKVDTISENTSANGVAIDSLGIKDGKVTNLMNATLSAADLGTGIHIKTADSSGDVSTSADNLVIEDSGDSGMTILGGTSNHSRINFGDSGDNDIGQITYDHGANAMNIKTNASGSLYITADGEITKARQPMFSVRPTNAVTNVTGDGSLAYLGSSITATERFDVGSNVSGMRFTAPVAGKYLLCGQLIFSGLASNHTLTNFLLVTSNQTYYPFYGAEIDTVAYLGSHGSAFSIIADMDASDTAQLALQVYGGSAVVDASTSTFLTGMLLA